MARTKTVFGSHAQTAHVWAQQNEYASGRSSDRRMFWEGAAIFSYGHHYTIAKFTNATDKEGKRVVLFARDCYSSSTGKHRSHVRHALQGLPVKIIHVAVPDDTAGSHAFNVAAMLNSLKDHAANLANTRKSIYLGYDAEGNVLRPDTVDARIASLSSAGLEEYCALFNLPMPTVPMAEWRETIRLAFERFDDPKRVRAREKSRARSMVKWAKAAAFALAHKEGVVPSVPWDVLKKIPKVRRAELGLPRYIGYSGAWDLWAKTERPARDQVTPEQWIEGLGSSSALAYNYGVTLVRHKNGNLETSRGAVVPFRDAVRIFRLAQSARQTGQGWQDGGAVRVGHFTLDAIDNEGNITVGCHTIQWDEMLRLAIRETPEHVAPIYPVPALLNLAA